MNHTSIILSRDIHVRRMGAMDVPNVAFLEKLALEEPHWSATAFSMFLRRPDTISFVATTDTAFAGFILGEIRKKRIELQYIAVHPAMWRQGIGGRMIAKIFSKAIVNSSRLTATVPERNLNTQLFLKAVGFTAVDYFPGAAVDGKDSIGFELRATP